MNRIQLLIRVSNFDKHSCFFTLFRRFSTYRVHISRHGNHYGIHMSTCPWDQCSYHGYKDWTRSGQYL